jgi:hypothetical protein
MPRRLRKRAVFAVRLAGNAAFDGILPARRLMPHTFCFLQHILRFAGSAGVPPAEQNQQGMVPDNMAYLLLNVQDAASGRLLPARRRRSQQTMKLYLSGIFVRLLRNSEQKVCGIRRDAGAPSKLQTKNVHGEVRNIENDALLGLSLALPAFRAGTEIYQDRRNT